MLPPVSTGSGYFYSQMEGNLNSKNPVTYAYCLGGFDF